MEKYPGKTQTLKRQLSGSVRRRRSAMRRELYKEAEMVITKRRISRRAVLRGASVSLALPFLDAMVPAMTPLKMTAASRKTRLVAIEMVHGAAGSTAIGRAKNYWSPALQGHDFPFTPTLKSLEPPRDYITVISNTHLRNPLSLVS